MSNRLFISPKDIMILESVSKNTAYTRYKNLLFVLNKPEKSKLTIEEYAQFQGLQVSTIVNKL